MMMMMTMLELKSKTRNRNYFVTIAIVSVFFVLGAVIGNCGGSIARSQDRPALEYWRLTRGEVTPVLALARLCVNESGMRAYARDDCAAIHATIAFRATYIYRSTYLDALHRYSSRVTVDRARAQDHGRRPWIAQLWPDGRQPEAWAASTPARWGGRHEVWWGRSYQHALDIMRGDIMTRCVMEPHHWARADVVPQNGTAERIDCGNTLNGFWSVPRYRARWGEEWSERYSGAVMMGLR